MMNGYGWCLLRATIPADTRALEPADDAREHRVDREDRILWAEFRDWMERERDPWVVWTLTETNNNDRGVLSFSVSRNHRASGVWSMLGWIASNGPGSYGLFYFHDDEDTAENDSYGRAGSDHSNRYRVHRLLHGEVTEMPDPFFGEVWPDLND